MSQNKHESEKILRSNLTKVPGMAITIIIATLFASATAIGIAPSGQPINSYAQGDLTAAPDSNPYGASYEEWAARYWQWLFSIPSDVNPIFDVDGVNCDENQPDGDVWFLVGAAEGKRERTCSVPEGKAVFMPIIALECDSATDDTLDTEEEFAGCVEDGLGDVTKVEATIDGTPVSGLEDHKVRSNVFEAQVPEINIVAGEGTVRAMTEGYWIMINPLPQGEHTVELRAEVTPVASPGDEPDPPIVTTIKYIAAVGVEATPIGVGSETPPPPEEEIDETPEDPLIEDTEDTTEGSEEQPSGCLIATAAFGSELTPQVQYLRNFRENYILSTGTGSAFMNTFNSVYYSFSPQVADYEREQPWLQQTVKTGIYPLFGILGVSERAFWAADGGNAGSVLAGATASLMIGAVYLSPVLAAAKPLQKRLKLDVKTLSIVAIIVTASLAILGLSAMTGTFLEASTAGFVVTLTGVSAILVSALWWRLGSNVKDKLNHRS